MILFLYINNHSKSAYKIKAVYDGRVVNSRESEFIRRSERDASTVETKQENAATDVNTCCFSFHILSH